MSEDQETFLKKVEVSFQKIESSHKKWKRTLIGTITVLSALLIGVGITNIQGVSANKANYLHLSNEVELVKKDYVDNFTANDLIRSFVVQTDILMKIDNKEIITIKEVNKLFNDFRLEALKKDKDFIKRNAKQNN